MGSEYGEVIDPIGGETHHVVFTMNGYKYGYMLRDISGFQRVDASDFSPKVSSGTLQYSDLHIWQVWAQDHWDHGFGFMKWADDRGYHSTDNGVDTRHSDIAMLATKLVNSESGVSVKKFIEFNGNVYALYGSNNGVRKFTLSTNTWADTSETSGAMLDGLNIGSYLVVCPNGARMRKMDTSGTWSNVGNNGNPPNDIAHVCLQGGYFWASEDGTNYLHYAAESDLSDLEGSGRTDVDCIVVGAGDIPIVNLIAFQNNLYVAREDGIWIIGDNNLPYQVDDFSRERNSQNCEAMAVYQGRLYYGVRERLYAYTGSTKIDVTPPQFSDDFPYSEYGRFLFMFPRGKFLYVIARSNESTPKDALLCFNGTSWFKLWDVATYPYAVQAMNLTPINDYVWLNHSKSGSYDTDYYRLQTLSDFPYSNFETTGHHYLYSSKFDAGFTDITKYFHSLTLRTQNLSANVNITVAYDIDEAGVWTDIKTFTTSPVQEESFPVNVTGKIIQFRFDFSTDTATSSPILDTVVVKYVLRPDTVWAYQMVLYLADDQVTLDSTIERSWTAHQKYDALVTARDSTIPIAMQDPMGDSHTVFVTSIQFMGYSLRESKPEGQEVEWMVKVGCIDAS